MTVHQPVMPAKPRDPRVDAIIKLAVMAVGGQGGSVLTNWIEDVARANGYAVQATSVAGVAQRTGATIYYIEMAPAGEREPVFSLMPAAGDVDILVAAELMEAGRAILRGFVTPDRTTLIASSHRALAVSEKTVPGDGIASAGEVVAAAEIAAQRLIVFDMDRIAVDNGTVISASLFGALAGSGTLPFSRNAFEAAIKAGGRGVQQSLAAFAQAFDAVQQGAAAEAAETEVETEVAQEVPTGPEADLRNWQSLLEDAGKLPEGVRDMTRLGLRKVVDFQDCAYGREYLQHLQTVRAVDDTEHDFDLTREAAKYLANAMAYDDVIKVADLKTRPGRAARIGKEMGAGTDNLLQITEFMHPRAQELVSLLPARWGRRVEARPGLMRTIDWLFNRGRRLRSDSLFAFLQLYAVAGLRNRRRGTLRHAIETEHLERWLATALTYRQSNYALAAEVLRCRRLIKGYSDTHARGLSKFDRVLAGIAKVATRDDAADWARRLREAALKDEKGTALDGALKTIDSFT